MGRIKIITGDNMSNEILKYIEAINKVYANNPPVIANEMVKIMTEIAMPKTNKEDKDEQPIQ